MADPLFELFAFALDLYRAPLKFLPYVGIERPIPRGFDALLEALNKREESEFWHDLSEQLKASPEQLRNAGFFLVKRLLFAEGADYYRILGLESHADIGQARERYRLLMALFHPDRNHRGDEWTEQYAPRINEAYNTLKNPTKKRAYDRGIGSEAPWGDDVPAPGSTGHGRVEQRFREEFVHPEPPVGDAGAVAVSAKRPLLHIWVGLVLLGLIAWFGVQVYESGALKLAAKDSAKAVPERNGVVREAVSGNTHSAAVTLSAGKGPGAIGGGRSAEPQKGADQRGALQAGSTAAASATAAQLAADTKGDVTAPRTEPRDARIRAGVASGDEQQPQPGTEAPGAAVVKDQRDAECPSEGCDRQDSSAPSDQDRPSGAGSVAAQTPAVELTGSTPDLEIAAEPPKPVNPGAQADNRREKKIIIGQRDIDLLVSRFIQAYEAGDIGKFVGLFSKQARSNEGIGRDLIAKQYRELFRTTDRRSMMIRDVMWTPKANGVAKISFFVAIETERPGSSGPEEYLGGVDLLAYMDLKKLKISKFVHRVGGK